MSKPIPQPRTTKERLHVFYKEVGSRLQDARRKKGVKESELARMLKVDQRIIQEMERGGPRGTSGTFQERAARVLEIDIDPIWKAASEVALIDLNE